MTDGLHSDIGPFSVVPEWLLDADVSDRAVRLYALLGRYANSNGKGAFPSRRTLGARLRRVSVDSVDRAIGELQQVGAISVEPRFIDGKQTTNDYVLHLAGAAPVRPVGAAELRLGGPQGCGTEREPVERDTSSPNGEDGSGRVDYVGFFVDEVRRVTGRDPLQNAKGRLGRHCADLAKQGVSEETIRAAVTEVVEAGLMVGAVLTVADQIHRGGPRRRGPQLGPGARDIAAMALELEAQGR